MLERLGVNTRGANMRTANMAAVIVTATLPAFATQGTKVDVTVSSLGDAKSLQGGTLLVTPLLGADGEVYAVSQGAVAISGFSAQGDAASITRGVPTVGRIANGGIVEREIDFALNKLKRCACRCATRTSPPRAASPPPSTTSSARRRRADRPLTVVIQVPARYQGNMIRLLTEIEQLRVEPDQTARIVIDERSGIIVMGRDVRVSQVAGGAGQPDGDDLRAAAGSRSPTPSPAGTRLSCRAPRCRSTRKGATSSPSSRTASRCATSSTG